MVASSSSAERLWIVIVVPTLIPTVAAIHGVAVVATRTATAVHETWLAVWSSSCSSSAVIKISITIIHHSLLKCHRLRLLHVHLHRTHWHPTTTSSSYAYSSVVAVRTSHAVPGIRLLLLLHRKA